MKKMLALLISLAPLLLWAQQMPFEGTWKIKPDTKVTGKPLTEKLQNGMYDCDFCNPAQHVQADGKDHEVKGSDLYDTLNVSVVDEHTIKMISKKQGKVVNVYTSTVSSDGKTMNYESKQTLPSGTTATNTGSFTRVSARPSGSHSVSGSWQQKKLNMDEALSLGVYKMMPDGSLSYDDKAGSTYLAKFDGKDYPMAGDVGKDTGTVSLKKIDDRTFEEWYKDKSGKLALVSRTKVAPNGKHATIVNENKITGETYHFEADKQ
jgi:hypothetical protein